MKKLLILLLLIPVFNVEAAGVIYENDKFCALNGGCPQTFMWNRNKTKKLARYQPTGKNTCDGGAMSVWIMGHPSGAPGAQTFTTNDWQDLEVAKANTGGYYRWGCCWSGQWSICLN